MNHVNYIKSPLNYTGGKYKLLPKILPLFPENIDTFIDLFCGGFNVGINVEANKIIANDIELHVIDFLENLKSLNGEQAKQIILNNYTKYNLSKTNREGFLQARKDYNNNPTWDMFYTIVSNAFNYQIRFNNSGGYNMPFGKDRSEFNPTLQKRFVEFVDCLNENIDFTNLDFRTFDFSNLSNDDFVYCDPPYLLSTASYNEQGGWNEELELSLLMQLTRLNNNGIRFALSNVLEHKGKSNNILKGWAQNYNMYYLNYNYNNCNYHGQNTEKPTVEVLITNY